MKNKDFNRELEKITRFRNKNRKLIDSLNFLTWVSIFMEVISFFLIRNRILGILFFLMSMVFIIFAFIKNERNYRLSQNMLKKLELEITKNE
jgi:hypothetical protein